MSEAIHIDEKGASVLLKAQENRRLYDTVELCPYCCSERGSKRMCCGEVHFESHYVVDTENGWDFVNPETGEVFDAPTNETRVG